MRRRRKEREIPRMLAEFEPTDWPGRTVIDKWSIRKEALKAYFEQHGWPGGALEMLRGCDDVRRRLEGRDLVSWGPTPQELAELTVDEYDSPRRSY